MINARDAEMAPCTASAWAVRTPTAFAEHLSSLMSSAGAATFEVVYTQRAFTFACTGGVPTGMPRAFALLFGHPRSFDPARIGFEEVTYDGAVQYTSSFFPHMIQTQWPPGALPRPLSNSYQLTEASHGGRMRIVAMAPIGCRSGQW